jgi:hypothetical protein
MCVLGGGGGIGSSCSVGSLQTQGFPVAYKMLYNMNHFPKIVTDQCSSEKASCKGNNGRSTCV